MSHISSDASPDGVPRILGLARYLGLILFVISFFLPAVGSFGGFDSAMWAIITMPWQHDDKISSLAAFGGWLNPEVFLFFCLSVARRGRRLRSLLTVTILFSIPMTWIAIHRMDEAGMAMYPLRVGHFFWITGILLIVLPELPFAFRFVLTRWLAVSAALVIAVISFPILVGLTMRPPSASDDTLYDLAWSAKDPADCALIDPNAVGRSDQRDSWDYTYMQSDCYRNVAAMLHEPQLCDYVKSAGIDRLIGSIVAKSKCRNQKYTIGTAFPGTRSSPFPFERELPDN